MMCAQPSRSLRRHRPSGRVQIFNETAWPVAISQPGTTRPAGVVIPPGDEATIAVANRPGATVIVTCAGRRRTYVLDLDLLGFDTVHVRQADLASPHQRR